MSSAREALLDRAIAWFTEHGVGDTSMRTIAEGMGTSHRMLHYHFGSREELLTAVVTATWGQQYRELADLLESPVDPYTAAYALWDRMADQAAQLGPLFFEVAAAAMQDKPWAAPLGQWIMEWKTTLTTLFIRIGRNPEQAALSAQMTLAMARGLLFELALTDGNGRTSADTAVRTFLESIRTPGG
jgi:AcrR family transcriptional regulator